MGLTGERLAYLRTGEEGDDRDRHVRRQHDARSGHVGPGFRRRHADQNDRDGRPRLHRQHVGRRCWYRYEQYRRPHHPRRGARLWPYDRQLPDNANNTDTDVDAYQVTLYGELGPPSRATTLNGSAAYGFDKVNSDRHNAGGTGLTARSDYNANSWSADAEAGRDFHENGMILTPNLTADWINWDPDSYTETGAGGADMHVNGNTLNQFELGGGVKAGWTFKGSDGSWIKPQLRVGYSYAVTDDQISDTAQFTGGGGAFNIRGDRPDRSTLDLGASVKLMTVHNWDFTGSYDFNWRSDYTSSAGFLRAGYKF